MSTPTTRTSSADRQQMAPSMLECSGSGCGIQRDPEWATPKPDEDPVMEMRNAISPYFGHDLVIS